MKGEYVVSRQLIWYDVTLSLVDDTDISFVRPKRPGLIKWWCCSRRYRRGTGCAPNNWRHSGCYSSYWPRALVSTLWLDGWKLVEDIWCIRVGDIVLRSQEINVLLDLRDNVCEEGCRLWILGCHFLSLCCRWRFRDGCSYKDAAQHILLTDSDANPGPYPYLGLWQRELPCVLTWEELSTHMSGRW